MIKRNSKKLDRILWEIQRRMLFLLCIFAVYILYAAYASVTDPSGTLGACLMIPVMIEHLLASLIPVLGLGALFEYASKNGYAL